VVKVCHGICDKFRLQKIKKPMYDHQRRCTICEVVFDINTIVCPCCSAITRGRPHKKKKVNIETIRRDIHENGPIYSRIL
jgi:hypothetical protein